MKTKIEIINETVEYYSADVSRRAVGDVKGLNSESCHYYKDGKMCAVGRCMIDPKHWSDSGAWVEDLLLEREGGDDFLKEEYRGHDAKFWKDLQVFHDTFHHWNENGITPTGVAHKDKLIATYA